MKYVNKRNGKVVELIEHNEKYKTVMLQEEGQKPFTVTTSTFKRWYKKLEEGQEVPEPLTDEQVEAQLLEQAQAVVEAEPLTSALVCAVETVPEVTPKKEKKTRAKKQLVDFTDLLQYIDEAAAEHGMVPYVREKQPYLRNYRINGEGPVVFLVYIRSRAIIQCKTKLLPETVYEQMKKVNHCFDRQYDITKNRQFAKTMISSITALGKTK